MDWPILNISCKGNHTICGLCVWLLPLSIFLRFIHVIVCIRILLLYGYIMFHWGFPGSSAGKESACHAGDSGSIAGSKRSPGDRIGYPLQYSWASLGAQIVKNLPAMRETWVLSLGWEDPLWDGMVTFFSILAGESPWTKESGRLQSRELQRVIHNWVMKHTHTHTKIRYNFYK